MNHCQICERKIKDSTGVIAHHGYRRPFQEGWQSASCFGARFRAYEFSNDAIQPCIDHIKAYIANQRIVLKNWMEQPPESITRTPPYFGAKSRTYVRPADFDSKNNLAKGSWSGSDEMYGYEHAQRSRNHSRAINEGEKDIKRLEKRLADWTPV